jgi:predicted RNase H-like HicB family nuclease
MMKYRAMLKQVDGWWIGWLVDLPGVNAQEKSKDACLQSLQIGAQDMLATPIPFEENTIMAIVEIPEAA